MAEKGHRYELIAAHLFDNRARGSKFYKENENSRILQLIKVSLLPYEFLRIEWR